MYFLIEHFFYKNKASDIYDDLKSRKLETALLSKFFYFNVYCSIHKCLLTLFAIEITMI